MKKASLIILTCVMLIATFVLIIFFIPPPIEDRRLTIGVVDTAAVICYKETEDTWNGINCEIIKAVADEIGYSVEFKEIIWANRDQLLEDGKIDCYIDGYDKKGSMTLATDAFVNSKQTLIYKDILESDNIGAEVIKYYTCAVQKDSFNYEYLLSLGAKKINEYNSPADIITAIKNSSSNIGIIDYGIYLSIIKDNPKYKNIVSGILTDTCGYRLVFNISDTERVQKINNAISEIKSDDSVKSIIDKYNGLDEQPFDAF